MNHAPLTLNPRYRLLDPLGAGGMGAVYRALDRLTGHIVALKRVNVAPEQLQFASRVNAEGTDALLLALAQEFKILASLRHPNIISVLDYGFDALRQPYFTMELLEQPQTLLEAARNQPLDFKINLLIQTLQALTYLHRRGILHHDLKPENVLVSAGQVRVLDFGLSVMHGQSREDDSFGTFLYLPPEIYEGGVYSQAGDMYAVGVMAYEMLAEQHPFYTDDVAFFVDRVLTTDPDFSALETQPGLVAVVAKLLAKQPESRYQEAHLVIADLCAAIGQPAPEESRAIRESFLQAATFVGREVELRQLTEALEQALQGHGSAWLIGGESGVGKSRLLEEVRTRALVEGFIVLRGQAVEGGGLPYQLWREPLRQLVLLLPEVDAASAGVVLSLIPDLPQLLGYDITPAPLLEGEGARIRLYSTITKLLGQIQRPLLFILEDLHWTYESLGLFRHLLSHQDTFSNLLMIGSYRHDEAPHLPEELPGTQVITLPRLSEAQIAQLGRAILGEVANISEIIALLRRETEGNTFFIVEVMRALAEEVGQLDQVRSASWQTGIVTQGMAQLLRRRIGMVPLADRPLLELAAVAGRQLDLPFIAHIAPELDLTAWLQRMADTTVLTVRNEHWEFDHDKLRATILANLPETTRRQHHERVALALTEQHGDDIAYLPLLHEHWLQAGNLDRALHYLPPLADQMVRITADFEMARTMLDRSLALIPEDDPRRASLLNRKALSYQRQGYYAQAQAIAAVAFQLAQAIDDRREIAFSLRCLGSTTMYLGDNTQARHYLVQSEHLSREIGDQPGLASSLNTQGIVAIYEQNFEQAHAYFQRSVAIYESLNYLPGIAEGLSNLGALVLDEKDIEEATIEEAKKYFQQSLAIRQQIGDQIGIGYSLVNLGMLAYKQQDYDQALILIQQSITLQREINDLTGIAYGLHELGRTWEQIGDIAAAERCYQESLTLARSLDDQHTIFSVLLSLGLLRLDQESDQAAPTLFEGLKLAADLKSSLYIVSTLAGIALLYWNQQRYLETAELIGLVQTHEALKIANLPRLITLLPQLEKAVGTDALCAALEHGRSQGIEATLRMLLAQPET